MGEKDCRKIHSKQSSVAEFSRFHNHLRPSPNSLTCNSYGYIFFVQILITYREFEYINESIGGGVDIDDD